MSKSGYQRRSSKNPSLRSSTSSLAPSAVFSTTSSYGTPRSSLGPSASLRELPEDTSCHGESVHEHEHWCTYGEHLKPTKTCEGWKRHEREHEVPYLCMPNGPVEFTLDGKRCALCFKADPDAEHLARHKVSICVGKFREPLKKSRKTDMVEHLARHRVHSKDAAALADRWRYALNKKNFSCGLCVRIFSSITERSNHIDNEHWRHGQNMSAWELSNCIRGLLLEAKVQAAWRCVLASYPNVVESHLRWEMPLAEGLQLRLERGQERPIILAKAALQLSNHGQIQGSQESLTATTGREETLFGPVLAATPHPEAATGFSLPDSTYEHRLPSYMQPCTSASASLVLPESVSSSNFEIAGTEFPNSQYDSLTSSELFDGSFQHNGYRNDKFLHLGPLIDLDIGEMSPQLSTYDFPTEWPSMDTNQLLHDNTQVRGHLIETGTLLVAQMSSPRHVQAAAYANPDRQRQTLDSRNDASASNSSRLPTSKFSHSSMGQYSHHGNSFNLRDKPLPPEPLSDLRGNPNPAGEQRPTSPMDIDTGSIQHCT